jgi:hypothetical protein
LPQEWYTEEDPNGDIAYYNKIENISVKVHPLAQKFKIIFEDKFLNKQLEYEQTVEHNNLMSR